MSKITYQEAMDRLVSGKFVRSLSWEPSSYIWLLPAASVPRSVLNDPHLQRLADANGGSIEVLPVIRMVQSNGKVATGWAPSIADICASWEEVCP